LEIVERVHLKFWKNIAPIKIIDTFIYDLWWTR